MNAACFTGRLCVCFAVALAGAAAAGEREFRGFSEPYRDINVAAPEVGCVERVEVRVGDAVAEGQALAGLDDAVQVSMVEIARQQAESDGALAAAVAERDLHRMRVERLERLSGEGHARPDEVLRAGADLAVAEARCRQAEEEREGRRLELQRYEMQLDRRTVRAPVAGVVSEVLKQPGEFVSPADPYVVRMIQVDPLVAVFNLPPPVAGRLDAGEEVRVRLGATRVVRGAVDSISPEIDAESGTVEVRVRVNNARGVFQAGDDCALIVADR